MQENNNPSEVFFSGPSYTYNGFRINAIGLRKKRFFEFFLAEFTHGLPVDQRFTVLNQKLHELSAHIEAGMEQERKRMAREIHDGLGSSLSAIKMEMSVLKKILSPGRKFPKDAETVYRSMEHMIDGSVALVRKLVTELRPEVLDELGFASTIQWYTGDFRLITGIETEVTIFPGDFMLEPALSMSIYRIFQEIMNNISKHAQASRVTVFIRKHNDRLELRVRDNGIGIREDETKNRRSFGIIGMQERTKLLNGQISISGTPGKGTVIHLEVPLI